MREDGGPTDGSGNGKRWSLAPREAFERALARADVDEGLVRALSQMPLERIIEAFACGRCATPQGQRACIAAGQRLLPAAVRAYAETTHQFADGAASVSSPQSDAGRCPGYGDASLMGHCLRALVPMQAVMSAVAHAVMGGRSFYRGPMVVGADGSDHDDFSIARGPRRMCAPSERDRLRLMALLWSDRVVAPRPSGAPTGLTASHWGAVALEPKSDSHCVMMELTGDGGNVNADTTRSRLAEVASMWRADPRLVTNVHPTDARIRARITPPFWSDDPTECNVLIDGDPAFGLVLEWND
jgi:hypothetical protein